ncbi:unnamed protein product [Sphagnum jensenii]|uniref:Uncharacterized protein n=1 Tax=Sphagnum jensenii TaxID=128206 RepID=A0ABP0VAI9_9BRYO
MQEQSMSPSHFVRVSVLGGGCSGLSYKMDFDDKLQSEDQSFEDKGVKLVTDLRSFLYCAIPPWSIQTGSMAKALNLKIPMPPVPAHAERASRFDSHLSR